jgi:hypothetical protein
MQRNLRTCFLLAVIGTVGYAQSPTRTPLLASSSYSYSVAAKLLVGFQDMPAGAKGKLAITPGNVTFTSSRMTDRLTRSRISDVFVGDERVETGGIIGKVARIAIPFGGGAVLGTITQEQVGLLTINYRDDHDGLRSVVFQLPKKKALEIESEMGFDMVSHAVIPPGVCNTHDTSASLHVLPIQSIQGLVVAPEYKSLLYENLIELPAQKFHVNRLLPDGEQGAECANYTLTLIVENFSKGNALTRAATGPAGLFVGVTKLAVRVELRDASGSLLLGKEVKASRRGDRESLTAASSAASDIAKAVKKTNLWFDSARMN